MTWAQGAKCSHSKAPGMAGQKPDLGPRGRAAAQHQHSSVGGEELWHPNSRKCGVTASRDPRAGLTMTRAPVPGTLGCSFD